MDDVMNSYCGLDCDQCTYREEFHCQGCTASGGHPFYGECQLAKCAQKHHARFCGECPDFACDLLKKYAFDPQEGDQGERIIRCRDKKDEIVAIAREGKNPIGFCGRHCDHCFSMAWCGGCRSDYDCCSYARLFDDQKCINRECAIEQGLEGCYDCENLATCGKGYYSNYGEVAAKTSAVFIHQYGAEEYNFMLKKAENDGMKYPDSFNQLGSFRAAMKAMCKYQDQDNLFD